MNKHRLPLAIVILSINHGLLNGGSKMPRSHVEFR